MALRLLYPAAMTRNVHRRSRRAARSAGFTLLEIVAGLSTLTVLLAVGAPSLGTLAASFGLDNGVRTIAMGLAQARVAAISRGHVVNASFTTHGFTMTDTQADQDGEIVVNANLPNTVRVVTATTMAFTPLGTVSAPQTITVRSGGRTRVVRVTMGGEVSVQ